MCVCVCVCVCVCARACACEVHKMCSRGRFSGTRAWSNTPAPTQVVGVSVRARVQVQWMWVLMWAGAPPTWFSTSSPLASSDSASLSEASS